MLKIIFFTFAVIAIMYEFWSIYNFDKLNIFRKKIMAISKKDPENGKLTGNDGAFVLLQLGYFAWCFLGLLSSQWVVFVFILLLSLMNSIFKGRVWNIIDSILTILALIFAILNAIHFHINLFDLVWNYIVGK